MLWLGQDQNDQKIEVQPQTLLRHAVCLGASGSGKTVACKVLCEEILLQGIPVLAVDPQGDIASMLLPGDPEELQQNGLSLEQAARFQSEVEVVVWTPGSEIGIPLSLDPLRLDNLPKRFEQRTRLLSSIAGNLTALLGYNLDSNDGRFVSAYLDLVLQHLVEQKEVLDQFEGIGDFARFLEELPVSLQEDINRILDPRKQQEVIRKLAVLGIGVRRLLFQVGTPLDIDILLGTADSDTTRLSVIYLNTLHSQGEKEFFVSQLAQSLVDWMLEHPSPELQAAFYIDEVAPFFPPISKPACKTSLQFLFKQARKYGIGCLLATQNPGDIDYRGLSQFSTWLLGRMMVQQDLKKLNSLLRSLQPEAVEKILATLPSLEPGHFFLLSPGTQEAAQSGEPFRVRWLLTEHQTLDEEQLEGLIEDELRDRFKSPSSERLQPVQVEELSEPEVTAPEEPPVEPELDPGIRATLEEQTRKLAQELLPPVLASTAIPATSGFLQQVERTPESGWVQEAWPISPSISYSTDIVESHEEIPDLSGLEKKLQMELAWQQLEATEDRHTLAHKLKHWKELESQEPELKALPAPVEEPEPLPAMVDEFKVPDEPVSPKNPKERRQLLLGFLESKPGAYTVAELNEILTLNEASLRRHLRSLKLSEDPNEKIRSAKMGRSHYYWLEKHAFAPTYSVSRPLLALPFKATVTQRYAKDLAGRFAESTMLLWRNETVGEPRPRYLLCWCLELECQKKKNVFQRFGNFLRPGKDARIVLYFHATTGKLMQKERHLWTFHDPTPSLSQSWKSLHLEEKGEWKTPGALQLQEEELRVLRTSEGIQQQWETELLSWDGVQALHNPRQLLALPYWEVALQHQKSGRERFITIDGLQGVAFDLK